MGNLKDLELIIERLMKETVEKEQIHILQEINKALLTKYVIKIDPFIIEPIWVEAYYFNKNNFPDCNTHMSPKQKNRFGQLYFHEKGRGGLDICLSRDDSYYLSFLLKAALIYKQGDSEKELKKQTGIYDILSETKLSEQEIEEMKCVLVKDERIDTIVNLVRANLQKPCFQDKLLGACSLHKIIDHYKDLTLPNGYKQMWICSVRALAETGDPAIARQKAMEYNKGSKIEEKYWILAKESLGYDIE